jgi:hypothetical protein
MWALPSDERPYWRRPIVLVVAILILVFVVLPFVLTNTITAE